MSSRQRQSMVSTPGGTTTTVQRQSLTLPTYEPPIAPLNPAAQQALANLLNKYPVKELKDHIDHAFKDLSNAAGDIHECLTEQSMEYTSRRDVRNGVETQEAEERKEELEQLKNKVDSYTSRMDIGVRKTIDGEARLAAVESTLKEIDSNARHAATAHNAVMASQAQASASTSNTQRSRVTNANNGSSDSEDDEDDTVTLPTQTNPVASSANEAAPPLPHLPERFTTLLTERSDLYTSIPPWQRYGDHNKYIEFKKVLHESSYPPGDKVPPLPAKDSWFRSAAGTPLPGITSTSATTSASTLGGGDTSFNADDGSDDDIAVAAERVSTKCPLTIREFVDPVTSRKCPHSFERAAIEEYIRNQPRAASQAQCPLAGCAMVLTLADLEANPVLVRRIRRIQRARELAEEARVNNLGDGEGGTAGGEGRVGAEEIESGDDSAEDVDAVAAGRESGNKKAAAATPAQRVKMERLSGRSARRGRGARRRQDDGEDDIMDSD